MMTIAETILQQLGGSRFIAMTGAKHFVGSEDMLMFSLPWKSTTNKANKCRVTLKGSDLYDLAFFFLHKTECTTIKTIQNVYAEDLQHAFTAATGLDTHL